MGVLASLLPGLRDLRAPLAAGYLWLLDLWLIFGDQVPSREEATGLLARIYALEGIVSQVGLAIAMSFLAYLVGIVSGEASAFLSKRLRFATQTGPRGRGVYKEYEHFLSAQSERILTLRGARGNRRIGHAYSSIFQDLEGIRARLMAQQTTLYGEYDRMKSEAEFRLAILPPLVGLGILLAVQVHLLWGLTIPPLAVLLYQAVILQLRADMALMAAVRSGAVKSPFLEDLENELIVLPEETPDPS